MKKFEPESQYMRKGVMVLFGIVILLMLFSCWYFIGHTFHISDEVFHGSALGSVPRWLPWTTFFTASLIYGTALKMNTEDKKRNKYVPCDAMDKKFHNHFRFKG